MQGTTSPVAGNVGRSQDSFPIQGLGTVKNAQWLSAHSIQHMATTSFFLSSARSSVGRLWA